MGVESGRLLFRAALADSPRLDGPVRDVVERFVPTEDPAEVWRAVRATAVGFVGGTATSEVSVLPVVVEDGRPVVDPEARRVGAADALLANWAAVARPTGPAGVLLVHVGETRTTARLVRFRPGVPFGSLAAEATDLAPVEFGLQNAVDTILDRLGEVHHDRARPTLDAPLLRAILEFGLALHAAPPDGDVRWRGPHAARLWQPMLLSPAAYVGRSSAGRLAPLVEEAARRVASGAVRVVFGGAGAFFPDVPTALATRLDRSMFAVDPGGVARGAARWCEASTASSVAPALSSSRNAVVASASVPDSLPPWAR